VSRDLLQQVNATRDGQWPFATILSCIDSRTSAELIFDQGLGDVFSIRIAGNIINDDILGSMEFSDEGRRVEAARGARPLELRRDQGRVRHGAARQPLDAAQQDPALGLPRAKQIHETATPRTQSSSSAWRASKCAARSRA
jgi:hypothetical protein